MVRGAAVGRGRARGRGARAGASSGDAAQQPESAPPASTASDPISISSTPTASAASTPAPTTQPGPPAPTRGTARPPGAALTGRLRPRNVRRNEEQREQLAQQEAKKDSERAAEERRLRGRARFRGRRGRGNQFGPRVSKVEASGLFQNEQGVGGSSRGGGAFGGGRGGFRGGAGGRRDGHKFEQDDGPWEMRINTDKLGVGGGGAGPADEEEHAEEERTLMAVGSQPGPRPLGITRREEKERELVVVTTAELEVQQGIVDEDSMWVDGSGSESPVQAPRDDGKVWHAAPSDLAQIKTEDGELRSVNPDAPIIDFDNKRKVPLPEEDEKGTKPAASKPKPSKPSDYSIDTEEQWEDESVQYILNTLAAASLGETKEEEGESPLSEPQPFLCKFGPVMPPLRPRARPGPAVKDEPSDTPMDEIAPVDLTADTGSGAGGAEEEETDPFKHGGFVGKLVVRKSGKAELDYGGIRYTMKRGIKSSGVTSYVVLEEEDVKPGKEEQYAGRAVAMGTLMGKFNFGPVWEEQEEWVVGEDELRADAGESS